MKNLNQLAKEAHEIAVSKGWWDKPVEYYEFIALCHSELSEALEEYRDGHIYMYYSCTRFSNTNDCMREIYCHHCEHSKPVCVAIELADCVIRILDYCAHEGIDVDAAMVEMCKLYDVKWAMKNIMLPELITYCHDYISRAWEDYFIPYSGNYVLLLALCIHRIMSWLKSNGEDLEEIIRLKMEYNKTRPYRHGGKVI